MGQGERHPSGFPGADSQDRASQAEAMPDQPMKTQALLIAAVLILGQPATALAQSCRSFKTCEEAMKSYKAGNTKLDRDKDGIPCESLCGNNSRQ
jgi:hypothetical protein